jgi:TolC family type I secretion outer membrane protein|tara:strand:+ start:1013 stop:2353 length:1341 start_codon:yes stop_codon:yes gene_type:complete
MKKIILLSFILFLSFISNSYSEDLFKTLTSTYLDNKELNSQREKTKAVDETLIQSYSIFKPSISGSYTQNDILNEGQRAPDGSSLSDSNFQTEKKSIKIEQKILQGIPKSLAARTNVNIARQELKAVEQNVLLKAVDAYASILAAEKKLKITEDNLNLSDKQVELDKSRYERGAIKLSDLAQSESSLAGAQAKFIRAQNDLLVNEQNFINIVGYKPDELNKINNLNLKLPQNIDEALKLASENNPDLLIAELKLKKSDYLLKDALEVFAPKASVSFEVSENSDVSSTINERDQSQFEAKVEIPIYSGGKNYSFYNEKRALKISSELDFQDAKNTTRKNATNIWSEYQLKKSELALANSQVKAAEIAYEGIVQEYESGARDTLDVLSSRSLLLEASLNLADVEKEEILSRFKLLQVTGNLTASYLGLEAKINNPEDYLKKNWIRHIF